MTRHPFRRLVICYVPAIDVRILDDGLCPYVAGLIAQHSWIRFRTQPATDLKATLLTGTWPHEHGLWGPRLRPDWNQRRAAQKLIDLLPDHATSTAQCLAHMLYRPMDLATIPPRRRRRFDWLRFKIKHIGDVEQVVQPINGVDTVFTVVGPEQCRFAYMDDYWRLDQTLAELGNGGYRLEMAEIHCLDHLLHWNRPGTDAMRSAALSLMDRQQRQRLRVPWHQADHGYLPDCDCEIGFMVVPDDGLRPADDWMRLIDFAPSVLALLGEEPTPTMRGRMMFAPAEGQRRAS